MPQYDNNMTGVLFKNDRKQTDKHPDYKGNCEIEGVEYWVSAWVKTKKDNSGKFLSLAFDRKEGQPAPASAGSDVPIDDQFETAPVAADDDIPF